MFRSVLGWGIGLAWVVTASGCAKVADAQGKFDGQGKAPVASRGGLEVVVVGPVPRKTLTLATTQPARLEPLEQAPIHSKLSAYVGRVRVDFGDRVDAQQPLLELLAPELDAERLQKQALWEQAKAEVVQAQAGVAAADAALVASRSQIAFAEAGKVRAEAERARGRLELERITQLVSGGSVNRQLADEAQFKFSSAQAQTQEAQAKFESAEADVQQAQAQVTKAQADLDAAKSRVQVAEANMTQVDALRTYLVIKAPFGGVVTSRRVDPGHFVQSAGTNAAPLLTVARVDTLRVLVAVPESEAAYVDIGDSVTVEIPALRGSAITCQVTRTSFAIDPQNRSLEVICDVDNRDARLRPGLFATARIVLQEQPNVLTLPAAAVVRPGKESFCFRWQNGKALKTAVQLGLRVGDDWEIAGGLSDGDQVILNKAASLQDGQQVERAPPAGK